MIKEMTEKLKSGQDLTPKEAERLYVAIKRHMNREALDSDLIGWFDAVYDALKEGRHGNFITAMPSCCEKKRLQRTFRQDTVVPFSDRKSVVRIYV